MGVKYFSDEGFGTDELLAVNERGECHWCSKTDGRHKAHCLYTWPQYVREFKDMYEVFPAWASDAPSQASEEKDLSDVNIIREALDGQRGEHQKLIAEYGVQVVATLIRKNSDYGGSAWQHPCLLQKLSGREGIQVRMSDKVQRLQKLLNGDTAQVAESIEDTMKDLVGYAMLWLAAPEEAR